jgi:ubiquinol-cytochrome c reductase iron-sulfur subunit
MSKLGRWLVAGLVYLVSRRPARARYERERLLPEQPPAPRAELWAVVLFAAAALCAVAFPVVYALDRLPAQTQLLGLALGLSFAFLSAACIVLGKRLVPEEEIEEPYAPPAHPAEREAVVQLVEESGDRLTRRRLLVTAAGGAGAALGVALVTPAVSFGPVFDVDPLYRTPWRPGVRLVDAQGRPLLADSIDEDTFYTAFAEGSPTDELASSLVVVRLEPARLELPDGREGWAPEGILAYSKICTHAACAVALYRTPLFEPTSDRPALVCPCHYSTFDPATGGTVLYGPAGRPLPQLPLERGDGGDLRAAGGFSGPVGPSWWGVRE